MNASNHAHQHIDEQAEEYALGVLTPSEEQLVEAHLHTCAACRALVDGYLETLALLVLDLHAQAPRTTPPSLDERILGQALLTMAIAAYDPITRATQRSIRATAVALQPTVPPRPSLWLLPMVAALLVMGLSGYLVGHANQGSSNCCYGRGVFSAPLCVQR